MVISSQRTIYGVHLSLAKQLGLKYHVKPNTTLNEKYKILDDYTDIYLDDSEYPTLKYMGIGIGGTDTLENVSGFSFSKHSAIDGACFKQIPFVIKPKENDLSASDRDKYRLRVPMTIENRQYYAYYLKVIDKDITLRGEYFNVSTVDGKQVLTVFSTANSTILNPTPIDRSPILRDVNHSEYVTALCKIRIDLEKEDIQNIKDVYKLLGITNEPPLSEVVLCTGVDVLLPPTDLEPSYREAKCVQVNYHVGMDIDIAVRFGTGEPVRRNIEIGGSEPYYVKGN